MSTQMHRFRTIYQKLSYKLGFARGLRGRPFAPSWWVDLPTYGIGHIEGRFRSLADVNTPTFPSSSQRLWAINSMAILARADGKTIS
jgi:hypothetical protein